MLQNLTPLLILTLLITSQSLQAGCSAGTVIYFNDGNENFLLLADHRKKGQKKRGWAHFSGGCEMGEGMAKTAARESEEESKGFFKREWVESKLETTPYLIIGDKAIYFVQIPFAPAQQINHYRTDNPLKVYKERGPYAWIPYRLILPIIKMRIDPNKRYPIATEFLPKKHHTDWFYSRFLMDMQKAYQRGIFP